MEFYHIQTKVYNAMQRADLSARAVVSLQTESVGVFYRAVTLTSKLRWRSVSPRRLCAVSVVRTAYQLAVAEVHHQQLYIGGSVGWIASNCHAN
jgi:hypothetical protein